MTMKDRPQKWIKRGPQPEVKPTEPSQAKKVAYLLAEIRECADPVRKAELEAAFEAQRQAYDAIAPEPKIQDTYQAVIEAIMPGANAEFSDDVTKPEWSSFHARLVKVKRHAGEWLSKSRKWASERWGIDYVTEAEVQMELDLGIQRIEKPHDDTPRIMRLTASAKTSFGRMFDMIAKDASTQAVKRQVVAALIDETMVFVERLRAIGREEA
jgi:hypothetical protein